MNIKFCGPSKRKIIVTNGAERAAAFLRKFRRRSVRIDGTIIRMVEAREFDQMRKGTFADADPLTKVIRINQDIEMTAFVLEAVLAHEFAHLDRGLELVGTMRANSKEFTYLIEVFLRFRRLVMGRELGNEALCSRIIIESPAMDAEMYFLASLPQRTAYARQTIRMLSVDGADMAEMPEYSYAIELSKICRRFLGFCWYDLLLDKTRESIQIVIERMETLNILAVYRGTGKGLLNEQI